jgi:putative intracellular protease/amidase
MNETPMPRTTTASPFRIGALLFPRFRLLDAFGPLDLFGSMEEGPTITILASPLGEVTSDQGPKAITDAGLEGELTFDLLLVPGGYGTRALVEDGHFLRLLRRCTERSRIVASVCTGAALLAAAGLRTEIGDRSNIFLVSLQI